MIVRSNGEFPAGYTSICRESDTEHKALMDFGIINLEKDHHYTFGSGKERAILLISGKVRFSWSYDGTTRDEICERPSFLDDEPIALHLPAGAEAGVTALEGTAELALEARTPWGEFEPVLWKPGMYRSDRFGAGTMQETSTRIVRTIFDAATATESGMVLGEVVTFPGKWSSYPPHSHEHPEVYHYRMIPEQGFGFAGCDDEVFQVNNGDSYIIPPGVTHPQCAAPGYAMYYVWAIPHLEGNRFGPDSRVFRPEHTWMMDSDASIWPDAPVAEVIENATNGR